MKNKKSVIIFSGVLIVLVLVGLITYRILSDDNKLTSSEKKWINDNINTVKNINVVNDVNIFGSTGMGIFYDFIKDLEMEHKIKLNPVTFNYGEVINGLTLGVKTNLTDSDKVFYTDHYVLVSKKDEIVANYNFFANKKIGVVKSETSYVSGYLNNVANITLTGYDNKEELLEEFKNGKDIQYIIVPFTIYLDEILKNDYFIINHMSDAKLYYTISGILKDDVLSNIIVKFYNNWQKDNLDQYFKREEFKLFTSSLGISETEVDAMRSVTYRYGFINNSPYEVIMSGNYGGIVAMYLYDFGEFSDIEFNFTKYNNLSKFKKAINKNEVDLYFNYYNLVDNYYNVDSRIVAEFSIVANKENKLVTNSIYSLTGETVYVQKNSLIESYLKTVGGIKLKTYNNEKDLKKLNKQDEIIVIDRNIFNMYSSKELSNYTERYAGILNETYDFKARNNSAFYKLLTKYAMSLDNKEMIYKGMYSHSLTVKNGSVLSLIAKYILLTITVFGVIFIVLYKSSKRIKIAKKIRKDDKIKFIDQLTSLKNRNYLNEYIHNWNNNTIYPQTMIVIDLNNLQFINDTLGYEEGDKQIMAAANILIKTQLDNSDVMRTDGNEFLVYLVGYTQKQITNYIHKLNKEFKKLPYDYGAEFGYSMINDSIKTIEDAIIEATEEMKNAKKKEQAKSNG